MRVPIRSAVFALALGLHAAPAARAQETWRLPPKEVVELVDAAPTPSVRTSPDARWMMLVERPSLPSMEEVARPWVGLAGLRVDVAKNARHTVGLDTGLVLRDLAGKSERRVALPEGARIDGFGWSHDSRHFAFLMERADGLELWLGDVESAKAQPLVRGVNGLFGRGFTWMPDGERLLCLMVPRGRGAAPVEPQVPAGPTILETSGKTSPARTFQDLLGDAHDAALFEHLGNSQVVLVSRVPDGAVLKAIGKPGLYTEVDPAPDGEHLLVTRLKRPFSYLLTYGRFPRAVEVWNGSGALVHTAADLPLAEEIPIEGVQTGPRSIAWRPGKPATLVWVEALDGGDPRRTVEFRDRWLEQDAPFKAEPKELLRTQHRARGLTWLEDGRVLAGEFDRDRRWMRTHLVDTAKAGASVVIEDRSTQDRYGDPGNPVLRRDATGQARVQQDGAWIYRAGSGATKEGERPFLDRQNLETLASERLWRCEAGCYESFVCLVPGEGTGTRFVTSFESQQVPPNYRLRDLATGSSTALTNFPDPTPQLRGIKKELVTYARADGVPLSATLYLPADHKPGTRLPLFVWAYPLEFNDASTAGQVSGSPHRFTRIGGASHLFLVTQGYAVLDGATMPVIGDPQTMNDTFVEQIVAAAQAAIDKAAEMGVADPARVGVGGHSYGAFMTANLLAHCDLFRAGIARSGAYNRTLTPFGFQSERRTLWEAPQIYAALSPFHQAHKINEPILLIHGDKDSNSGTFPIQSERLYQAIQGHGGSVRLVRLPAEDHGYRSREAVLHTLAEMIDWLDRHVKSGPGGAAGAVEASSGTAR